MDLSNVTILSVCMGTYKRRQMAVINRFNPYFNKSLITPVGTITLSVKNTGEDVHSSQLYIKAEVERMY